MMQTRLMRWLEEHGFTMTQAAKKVGISPQAVSKHALNNAQMYYPVAMAYHRNLGVPLELLDKHHEDAIKNARKAKEGKPKVPAAKARARSGK